MGADMQTSIFDYLEGTRRRDAGVAQVEANNSDWVQQARNTALMLAAQNGEVTSDEVQKLCPRPAHIHPNATGSIFKDKRFRFIGHTPTKRIDGHARTIKIWGIA